MYKTFPQNYITLRNKISRIWHCIQYKYIFKHERIILTVSEFSKKEIERNYPKTRGKIYVIPNGWQHVNEYKPESVKFHFYKNKAQSQNLWDLGFLT